MEHHPTLAPSSFPALQVCSHFVSKGEGNKYADRGERIHEVTELIVQGVDAIPTLADDERICAEWMAQKTRALIPSVLGTSVGIEVKDPLTGEPITYGTLDCYGQNEVGEYVIVDWKTGQIDDYDAQIMIYALGLMDKEDIDSVMCYFIYGDKQKVGKIYTTKDECEALLADTLRRREDPDEPYQKSKFCNRCAIRPECPLWNDAASEALAVAGMEVQMQQGLDVIVKDPDKLGVFLKGWKAIAKLIEDYGLHDAAIDFIESGHPVGDFEVRERKGRREYTNDSVATLLDLIREGDLGIDEAAVMFNLNVKEVDKFFKEKNKPCPVDAIIRGTYKILVEKNGK